MKKKIFLIAAIAIFLILVYVSLIIFIPPQKKSVINQGQSISQVCFQENCFEVELARTTEEITRGLMFRKELPQNKGMLFVFEKEGIRPFWMKNTLIPLDIIWLNKNKEVVFIKKNAEPCGEKICLPTIPPQKAQYVLEINTGLTEKLKMKIGEQLILKLK